MSEINDNPPAFSMTEEHFTYGQKNAVFKYPGMQLRDYFAGQALIKLIEDASNAKHASGTPEPKTNYNGISKMAYKFADAMLKARKQV